MPQTLVSSVFAGGSDRKIICETLASATTSTGDSPPVGSVARSETVGLTLPDMLPESFFLSKEAEIDWLDQNAFYERKESQKGNSTNLNPNLNPNSSSQRIPRKPIIIGLPKSQKRYFNEAKNRRQHCKNSNTRLIPKRVGSRWRRDPPLTEPSSPNVSCIGRVRSRRDRSCRIHRQKSGRSDPIKEKSSRIKKPGLLATFRAFFRIRGCRDVSNHGSHTPMVENPPPRSLDIRRRLPPDDVDAISSPPRKSSDPRKSSEGSPVGTTGLGGMKRFASGRRADLKVDLDVA